MRRPAPPPTRKGTAAGGAAGTSPVPCPPRSSRSQSSVQERGARSIVVLRRDSTSPRRPAPHAACNRRLTSVWSISPSASRQSKPAGPSLQQSSRSRRRGRPRRVPQRVLPSRERRQPRPRQTARIADGRPRRMASAWLAEDRRDVGVRPPARRGIATGCRAKSAWGPAGRARPRVRIPMVGAQAASSTSPARNFGRSSATIRRRRSAAGEERQRTQGRPARSQRSTAGSSGNSAR